MPQPQEQEPLTSRPDVEQALLHQQKIFHNFMHECRDCQREIAVQWQFCAHCGSRLATQCPGCGHPLPPAGALMCVNCGLAIPQIGT